MPLVSQAIRCVVDRGEELLVEAFERPLVEPHRFGVQRRSTVRFILWFGLEPWDNWDEHGNLEFAGELPAPSFDPILCVLNV
ncbi:hypothetical protein GS429_02685 [Natronorubrum sp. JWXQ-INN-674]|uniref:Uncharacterized protein n=1 Tax=Natronorubrum halalkaliphilum TaxID=2691917 RepID=A0A6B0VGP4_9EURY|nr:hypothetical protein [Natronorubrum halalkaliphilum]MXV60981.1 hypothetical protein [Natronorubrum halalkaliphilum]